MRDSGPNIKKSAEELYKEKLEAKNAPPPKPKKRNNGRGIEGKTIFTLSGVSKYVEDTPLFENVNLTIWQGYVHSQI